MFYYYKSIIKKTKITDYQKLKVNLNLKDEEKIFLMCRARVETRPPNLFGTNRRPFEWNSNRLTQAGSFLGFKQKQFLIQLPFQVEHRKKIYLRGNCAKSTYTEERMIWYFCLESLTVICPLSEVFFM